MTQRDWEQATCTTSGCSSTARSSRISTCAVERIEDDSFLLLFNAHYEDIEFRLPNARYGASWDSRAVQLGAGGRAGAWNVAARGTVRLIARSVVVLMQAR
jgi:glycogen operon protein